jgi:hypothetical protein
MVIASGQAMFKPGLDGFSYGVGPEFGGKAVTLVSTQREQPLLCLCLGLLAHPPPLPLARGAKSDIDGRARTNTTVGGLAVPVGSDMSALLSSAVNSSRERPDVDGHRQSTEINAVT